MPPIRIPPPPGFYYGRTGRLTPLASHFPKKQRNRSSLPPPPGTESDSGDDDSDQEVFEYDFSSGNGALSEIANIYRSKKDDNGEWTYSSELPEDIEEAAENEETAKCCLVIRNKKSQDSRKKLEAESIIVQSPWLKKALSEILKDYPGVVCELRRLEFQAPFKPFVHRWTEFTEYLKKPDLDTTAKSHLEQLHNFLSQEIGDKIKDFEDYVMNGVINYESLWMVFQPGTLIISEHTGAISAFELTDVAYAESMQSGKYLNLNLSLVDWDGYQFGRKPDSVKVPAFSGTRKITSLNAFPLHFHRNQEELHALLVARGQKFEQLAGYHYKAYNGKAIWHDSEGFERPTEIAGRIVIDGESFKRFSGQYLSVGHWTSKDKKILAEYQDDVTSDEEASWAKVNVSNAGMVRVRDSKPIRTKLGPYHHMLCSSRVKGYSLKLKKWLEFFVTLVNDIEWDSQAFGSLVLPEKQKELILAFSESQLANQSAFDDLITGKGRGVIMLLSGKPGVGKTLTAEAVAENMHCPLYSISSGDLGSLPHEVEQSLGSALNLVSRWNAVLLIDECDVFLESRATHDIERNRLVSIFLRTLEYFEGILFMTTNRMNNIDPAFHSRIHISLNYPELVPASRRQIWANFLNASKSNHSLTEQDIDGLSLVELNGRQIKNVLKTSHLLALRKGEELSKGIVEMVLSIEQNRPEGKLLNG